MQNKAIISRATVSQCKAKLHHEIERERTLIRVNRPVNTLQPLEQSGDSRENSSKASCSTRKRRQGMIR